MTYHHVRRDAIGSARHATARLAPFALAFGLLNACNTPGSPPPAPDIFIITATATANEPAPVLSPHIRQTLWTAGANSVDAIAYVVDPATGDPTIISLTPHRPDGQVDNEPTRSQHLAENVAEVQRVLNREAARRPFDLLNTIATAMRAAAPPATLIVLSSGLSTSGGLDMRQVGWDANPAFIAAHLKTRRLLPALANYRVIFSGLGLTSGRQPTPSPPQRRTLTEYWLAICRASNADSCNTDVTARPGPSSRSTTPVPVILLPTRHKRP